MPSRPRIIPAVGKSGPGMKRISSATVALGLRRRCTAAPITSPMLWGGMLVAMPTAMPADPLTSRLGNRAGRTTGSTVESSKFGDHSTVSLSMSASR